MSIILRANELNTLIYKYLLECGLSHTAYTLFNEANLAQPLQEFRYDVKSGHLLSLLEKALIYAQIESHVSMSDYTECLEPFYLLKTHICKITERARAEREDLVKGLENTLNDSIKRTNSIYNTAIANKDFDDIVYDPRGNRTFEKFTKIRLPAGEAEDGTLRYAIEGSDIHPLLYNSEDGQLDLLHYDGLSEQITIQRILPCVWAGKIQKLISFSLIGEKVIQVFSNNRITIINPQENVESTSFTLQAQQQLTIIEPNPSLPNLITIRNQAEYCVLDLETMRLMIEGRGFFCWKDFDEFMTVEKGQIYLRSLTSVDAIVHFGEDLPWQSVKMNSNKTLFAAYSLEQRFIHIYTYERGQPLFIFNLQEERQLKQVFWVVSNSVEYIGWLTSHQIKLFDVSLNTYSAVIDLQQYDPEVSVMYPVRKADRDQVYLVALGKDNVLLYDVTNAKMERVDSERKVFQLKPLSLERVAMLTENTIYFLTGQYIDPLFK